MIALWRRQDDLKVDGTSESLTVVSPVRTP